jgi:uncharacterized protein with HEPN domain/predicted nucleotidyltransferase
MRTPHKLEDMLSTLRACLPSLRERYGVKCLGVFGSYVRGEQRPRSDLDVLVEFEQNTKPSLLKFVSLQQELSDALGVKVDLVEKAGLKPYIGRRILEEVINVQEAENRPARLATLRGDNEMERRPREVRDYLNDILDSVAAVEQFTQGVEFQAFSSDTEKVYATLHALMIIGEAVRKIPIPTRRRYPEIPWRSIVGLRNVVTHAYFAVQLPRIWQIIHEDLPRLREVIALILDELEQRESHA